MRTLIIAGHETTAFIITIALVGLCVQPALTSSLRQQVIAAAGSRPIESWHLSAVPMSRRDNR